MIPQWLAAPEWTPVVKTLLHTLWQGMVLAVFLGLALRRLVNPAVRYRCALGALGGVMICGLVTWALLSGPPALASNPAPDTVPADAATTTATVSSALPPLVVNFSQPEPQPLEMPWTAWLALLWVAGATLMLGRAGFQVAGAERLRRAARPLEDARLVALLADARRAVGLARRVRLAVTEKLSSPVVAGVLVPTLIIPLSLTTTLTQDQLRFILLHELAHIRRGDYFANLFQLFAEALLFFNPAVWWISRQMRLEREACCDALAVELSGAPADYARTLLHVVENVLSPAPAAVPAFGDPREPSTLADRLQRMLVPGYRPALRLTWRAMFAALLTGGTLLFLSALGTRVTIAAILTPQQRIDRIEKKMTEYGESPVALNANGDEEHAPKVKIAGHIRMADGSPVPQWVSLNLYSSVPRSSSSSAVYARDGKFSSSIRAGTIYLGAETTNYAPAVVGPLDGLSTNAFEDLEIVFDPGYDVPLQVVDADSEKPLTNGTIATLFWMSNHGFQPQPLNPGFDGSTTLTHCAELPLDITVNVPGYEIVQKHFEHIRRGENLRVALRRGNAISGIVLDRATGRPVAGAEFHLLYQSGGEEARRFQWTDAMHLLGTSDANGAFSLAQLQPGKRYYLGVTSPGHESVVLEKISPGAKPFTVRLGPELIVRGHVTGSIDDLQQVNRDRVLNLNTTEMFEQNSYGDSQRVPLQVSNGLITFQFTNRAAGRVTLSGQSYREERDITAPVDDWIVDLRQTKPVAAQVLPTREVIFRFKHPSGVPPRGLVSVSIPDITDPKNLTSRMQDLEITNGEVHVQIAVGGQTLVESKRMVGYWFNHWNIAGPSQPWVTVTAGPGPLIFDIPLIAAGAIYAQARNVDGTPAGGLFFGVSELKPAPGRGDSTLDGGSDSFSSDAPRKWVSGPLPLGGTYQVHAWRGNAFCVSRTVKLTEANPDAVVELHFAPGKTFQGTVLDAGGKPLRDAELKISFSLADNHSFGLKSVFTDARGNFTLENTAPDLGTYSAEAIAPGHVAEVTKFNFKSQPQIIRLKPGRTLGGRLVESGTGLAIPGAEVRALVVSSPLPIQTTHADADGRFQFNTLGDGEYTLFVEDGQNVSNQKCRANGNTNLTVKVKLYAWSKVKPKTPVPGNVTNASSIQVNLGAKTAENEPANGPTNIIVKATPVSMASANWSPTNGPSILITTHFSRIDAQSFDRLTSNLRFNAGYRSDDNWWSISPRELHAQGITDFGFVAGMSLGSPRLQTFSGQEAEIYIGNGTNGLWFDCTPTIHNGLIDLAMHGKVVEENKNVVSTNQFQAHAAAENLGTVIVRLKGTGYPPTSYLVAAINVQINYNRSATNQNRSLSVTERSPLDDALLAEDLLKEGKRLYGLQKFDEAKDKLTAVLALNSDAREAQYYLKELSRTPAQRAIVAKLQRLRVPAPGANHLKNLDELVQWLNQVANEKDAQQPDIRFRIDPNTRGSTSVFLPAMDLPLINILDNVTSMNGVNQLIQYTVVDDGVVFSQAAAKPFVYTGPGRQAIIAKLDKIHFDSVYYDDLPLNEVLKQLAEQCRLRDPEHKGINFLINNTPARPQASLDQLTGLPMNLATNTGAAGSQPVDVGAYLIKLPSLADVRLADVLDALVRTSDHPLQYSVQDFAIVFSARGPTNTPLFMRTFGVDFNTLSSRFRLISPTNQSGDRVLLNGGFTNISGTTTRIARLNPDGTLDTAFSATNLLAQDSASAPAQLARNFFATLGIDLANPPGKSVFFNDRLGRLSVRATATDLDKIEKALAQLEEPPASTNPPNPQAQPTANPPPVDQLLAEGKTLYEAGKFAQAREKLKAAQAQDPKNATAQYYLNLMDAAVQNQKTNHLQSGREKILTQLDRIHIHSLSYDNLKLEQVIRQLNEAADPEKLGFNISTATNAAMPQWSDINSVIINIPALVDVRLADVLDAMVLVADKPIKYSILDSGIVFSGKSTNSPQLFLRTFRIDPNTFYSGLENVHASDLPSLGNIGVTNHGGSRIPTQDSNSPPSRLAKAFFTTLGVDFDNPPGKSVFFNDRLGSLFVKATEMDLDTIERAIQILNQAPPQVHLKVRYYEVPHGSASGFLSPGGTNATAGRFSSTLTDPNFRATLKALFVQTDVENLGEAEVTVITGRQTQMQLKKPGAAAENWNLIHGQVVMPPTEHEARGYIDIVPYVLSDGYTINLAVIPSGIFQLRNVVTTANVWDNQTLVVDCLHGDKKDRDLLIFITATIVGPAGSRVHTDDEMPYAQTNIPSQPAPPAKQLNSIAATNPVAPSNSVQPTLPATNPQLHLKARFIETPKGTLDDLGKFLNATNPTDGQPMGILFAQDAESAIQTLKARKGFEIRAEPEITVTSGRRVQMRATDMITVVTNLIFQQPQGHPLLALSKPQITGTGDQQVQMRSTDGTTPANNLQAQYGQTVNPGTSSIQPQTSSVEVGTTLEMVPHVLSDGFSVNLTAMPSLTEFYGYKDLGMVTNRTSNPASFKSEKIQLPIISPQFRTQKLDANVNLWDGQTLVLSGFKTRSFQSASKPKSGDTPTLGRLFTHTNSVDKDLLIFITATIVDSTDRRIHSDADLAGLPPQPPQP